MDDNTRPFLVGLLALAFALAAAPIWAGYKARPWKVDARERYPASLTSEGVTIAVEPLFTDALAARVFDKNDILTRGIMPLAIVIFNDNDFPVEVDGLSIELIHEKEHIRTMSPNEVVHRLFRKDKTWIPQPIPRASRSELNADALDDFDSKFLMEKVIAPHDKGAGFLYLHVRNSTDLASYLASSVVYIPNIYRRDNGSRMIFFEIGLEAAIPPGSRSDRRATPMRPLGSGVARASAAVPLLDDVTTSPASRRLTSAHATPGTRPLPILGQAPS